VIRKNAAHQVVGNLGKTRGRRDRRIERYGASDRVEVGEANADCHGPPGPAFRPETGGDPIGKMQQRGPENSLVSRLLAER
jgi:hypothetical protein